MIPLLLLPGMNTTPSIWNTVTSRLVGIPCLTPDLPDMDNVDAMAEALLGQAPARFALAGYSLGGYVALAMAAQAPERVARLALVSTGPYADTPDSTANRRKVVELARAGKWETIQRNTLPFILHPTHVENMALRAELDRMAGLVGVERYARQQQAAATRPDRLALLRRLTCSVALVVGDEDRVTPPALHRDMASAMPHARLTIIERSGHMLPLEQGAALADALMTWLKDKTHERADPAPA